MTDGAAGPDRRGRRAAAVTGVGVLSPAGRGEDRLWSALATGTANVDRITHFDTTQTGTDRAGFVPDDIDLPGPGHPDRMFALAREAVLDALTDAGVTDPSDATLVLATTDELGAEIGHRWRTRAEGGSVLPGTTLEDRVAAACGLRSTVHTVSTTSAAGCVALGVARRLISSGHSRLVVVCGVDVITEIGFHGLASLRTLSPRGCRPFSASRSGIHIAEAAAALVVEAPDLAAGREQGWLEGAAANNLAAQPARPEADGVAAAVRDALRMARRRADEVGYVNAHAAGTRHGDPAELDALGAVFGSRLGAELPVVSSKAALGHCQGAAGTIEAIVSLATLRRGEVLPTLGLDDVDPAWADLNLGQRQPDVAPTVAVSVSCGLGGMNAAVVLGTAS